MYYNENYDVNEEPTLPKKFNFSFKYFDAKTVDTNILSAPKGVTRDAGAKA